METNLERWSRATEEIKFYDEQLKTIPAQKIFQDIMNEKASKILDPKTQLFYKLETGGKKSVSSRSIKK